MNSGVFLDNNGEDDGRDRHDVLTDYRFHQYLDDDLHDISIDEALDQGVLEEELRDDKIYFVDKYYYHTYRNVDTSNAHKVNAGPKNEGRAGDLDVGTIHIPTGKVEKIELKSPGRIPSAEERKETDQTYDPIIHAEKQNEYLKDLLDNIEKSRGMNLSYSSHVEAWNDAVTEPIFLNDIPQYSNEGRYLCTSEAREKAEESEIIEVLDNDLFKGRMFGGGEDILENI